jgi:hypothetical protein
MYRSLWRARSSIVVLGSGAILLLGCNGSSPTSPPGSLQIEVFTSGLYPDPDGYTVVVSGQPARELAIDASLLLPSLSAGSHTMTIGGLESNCSLIGSPTRNVEVSGGQRTIARIEVHCLRQPDECALEFDLAVSSGTTPEFIWNPVCRITWLSVVDLDAPLGPGSLKWQISGPPFAAPVQYGVAPEGTTVEQPATPLITGHTTRVVVQFENGEFPLPGGLEFTP